MLIIESQITFLNCQSLFSNHFIFSNLICLSKPTYHQFLLLFNFPFDFIVFPLFLWFLRYPVPNMIKHIGLSNYSSLSCHHKWISIGLVCLINIVFVKAVRFDMFDEPNNSLQLEVDQETNLLPVVYRLSQSANENLIKCTGRWLKSKNLRCTVKLETDYSNWDYGNITRLIVLYENDKYEKYQIWLDSDETSLFSKEYFIDLPMANDSEFRLKIEFQIKTMPVAASLSLYNLVKTLSTHRCWNTYQSCPVLSCSTKDINNQSSCSFSPDLSFNCSTPDLCIYQDEVCDYQVNCPDGSDELNCGHSSALMSNNTSANELNTEISSINNLRCSFEVDYCYWRPFKLSNESCFWGICSHNRGLIRTIAAESLTQGPTFDHTRENPKGHYLLLKSGSKRGRSTGSIVSLMPIGGNCKLILHYLTNSRSSQILIRSSDNSSSFNPFSTIEVIDLDWEKSLFTRVEVDLDLSGEWLFLVTMIKGDENSYLALDDIYFTKGCNPLPIPESSLSFRPPTLSPLSSSSSSSFPSTTLTTTASPSPSSSSPSSSSP